MDKLNISQKELIKRDPVSEHRIKINLPIIAIGQGHCPHSSDYHFQVTVQNETYWCCHRCSDAIYDWTRMLRSDFYDKYPELKPKEEVKVTLDEADKQPGPKPPKP